MEGRNRSRWMLVGVIVVLVAVLLGVELLAPEPRFPGADPF